MGHASLLLVAVLALGGLALALALRRLAFRGGAQKEGFGATPPAFSLVSLTRSLQAEKDV